MQQPADRIHSLEHNPKSFENYEMYKFVQVDDDFYIWPHREGSHFNWLELACEGEYSRLQGAGTFFCKCDGTFVIEDSYSSSILHNKIEVGHNGVTDEHIAYFAQISNREEVDRYADW